MSSRPQNPNRAFLLGSAILAFAVIFIVVLFTMLSLRAISKNMDETLRYSERYVIRFSPELEGASVGIYINDSLLFDGVVPTVDSLQLEVVRFDEENALLVVDNVTERVSTFELGNESGCWIVKKEGTTWVVAPSN